MRTLSIIGIIFVVVVTVFITATTPQMHKRVVFGSSQIEVVSNETKSAPVKTEVKPIQTETKQTPVEVKKVDTDAQNRLRMQAIEAAAKREAELKLTQQKTVPAKTKIKTQKPAVKPTKTAVKPQVTVTPAKPVPVKQVVKPVPVKTKPIQKPPVKKEIDWEPWRIKIGTTIFANTSSRLKSTVPIGTQYEYSFNVDNNKKVSDIRVRIVTSSNRVEAEKGVNIIIPAIMNLGGKSTLTYPAGAEGVTTAPMKAIITVKEG